MRKLFWQMSVTLDGFMEGPNHELTHTAQFADPDFDRYASDMLKSIGAVVLGRVTYELFAGYWPNATGPDAERLNELPKITISTTLKKAEWNNSRLVRHNVAEEISNLKHQPGKDIALFGSAKLASTLMKHGLIDEYRLLVTPIVLGGGARMFKHLDGRVNLKLLNATTWSSGTVALYYRPA